MKLHLGSGKKHLPGFLNVDIDPANEPDVVANCFSELFAWGAAGKADLVYACHVLEHCGRNECKAVLKRWHSLLKLGGILRLSVPDLVQVFNRYRTQRDLGELLGLLYGGQRDEHDYHKMGWDETTLTRDLFAAGFSEVRRWDWRTTEHAAVDDYSQAYLPHIRDCKSREEYERGASMSLNLEAVK